MNKKLEEMLDEAYRNYLRDMPWLMARYAHHKDKWYHASTEDTPFLLLSKEEFIDLIETDEEFAEKWGISIEKQDLTIFQRIRLCLEIKPDSKFAAHDDVNEILLNDWNIPTKLITYTYTNKIFDYE